MNKRLLITIVFALYILPSLYAQNGGISIGKGREIAHGKAILELVSDSKGLLIPRLSTINREAMFAADDATAIGLMVFDTNESAFFYYTGSEWSKIGSGAAGSNVVEVGLTVPDATGRLKGELFFETTTNKLAVFDGTAWKLLGNSVVQSLASVLANGSDADGKSITNLAAPTADNDAATKKYVDEHADMTQQVYDINKDGKVDNSEKVNGLTVETAVPVSAVFTDNQTLKEILDLGTDADGKTITNLATPTADADAATKKYVDEIQLQADWNQTDATAKDFVKNKPAAAIVMADVYYGTLAVMGTASEAQLTALSSASTKNGAFGQSYTSAAGYFTFAMPIGWRAPLLKIGGDETLMVFNSTQKVTINSIEYTVWQTDVELPAGLTVLVK